MFLELPHPPLPRSLRERCPQSSLLFFGLNYAPEMIGIAPYTTGLAEELSERGHRVRVIAGQPYYPRWRAEDSDQGAWVKEGIAGVEVYRCPLYVPSRPSFLRRMVHYASFAVSAFVPFLKALRREKPDAIVAIAPSLVSCMLALVLARMFRIKFWLHIQDFEVEMAAATGMMGEKSRLYRAALWLESKILRRAHVVSTISTKMCEKLEEKNVRRERILQLRNWANHAERIRRADGQAIRRKLGLQGKTVALYSGNIAAKQGIDVLIDAAEKLKHRDDIVFVICGDGPNRAALERQAAHLPNIRMDYLHEPDVFAQYAAMADIHLLPQMAGAADLVLPSKLTNMLASGKPVVATAAAGTGLAREVFGCGLVIPPGDVEAFARAIVKLTDDPELGRAQGREGVKRAESRWSLDLIADRFEHRLRLLVDEHANAAVYVTAQTVHA